MHVFHQGKSIKKAFNVGAVSLCFFISGCGSDDEAAVNTTPTFDAAPLSQSLIEVDEAYSGKIMATDADGDALVFTKQNGPDWFSVAADGTVSLTHTIDDIGSAEAIVVVSDGENSDAVRITLTVSPEPEKAPTNIEIANMEAIATIEYRAGLSAIDENELDTHTFTVEGADWLEVYIEDEQAVLKGTPPESAEGELTVVVKADDGSMSIEKDFVIVIAPKPVAEAPEFKTDVVVINGGVLGEAFTGDLTEFASDPNPEPLALTFELLTGPKWLQVNEDGTLSSENNQILDDEGNFTNVDQINQEPVVNSFTVRVYNTSGKFDDATLQITNPSFSSPALNEISLNALWGYQGQLLGSDGHDGSSLTYSFVDDNDLFEVSATGTVTIKRDLAEGDYSTHALAVNLSDGVASVEKTVNIEVAAIHDINNTDDFDDLENEGNYMGWFQANTDGGKELNWFSNRLLREKIDGVWTTIGYGVQVMLGAELQKNFSTLGRKDINLSYSLKKMKLDGEEFLDGTKFYEVQWSLDGITWTTVKQGAGEHNKFIDESVDFPADVNNQPIVAIRFVVHATHRSENIRLDNITITGAEI